MSVYSNTCCTLKIFVLMWFKINLDLMWLDAEWEQIQTRCPSYSKRTPSPLLEAWNQKENQWSESNTSPESNHLLSTQLLCDWSYCMKLKRCITDNLSTNGTLKVNEAEGPGSVLFFIFNAFFCQLHKQPLWEKNQVFVAYHFSRELEAVQCWSKAIQNGLMGHYVAEVIFQEQVQ